MTRPLVEPLEGALPRWRLRVGASEAELAPSRGALVTRFAVDGEELLFLDAATLLDPSKNVRGGIPLLFPFAGKPPPGTSLPQHGFARRRPWEVLTATSDGTSAWVECVLRDDAESRAAWPWAFELRYAVTLSEGGLSLEWTLFNRDPKPLPLHFGIHPYFLVGEKALVRVEGASGLAFDNRAQADRHVDTVDFSEGEVDLHFAAPASRRTRLERGLPPAVALEWSPQFDTLVLWTLPGQPFVCVEPWSGRGGVPATRFVDPGQGEHLSVVLRRREVDRDGARLC